MNHWIYDELAEFAQKFPRIPKQEFECHPDVVAALRELTHGDETLPVYCPGSAIVGIGTGMLDIPVKENPDMLPGAFVFYEDGAVVAFGHLKRDEGLSQDSQPQYPPAGPQG